MQLAEIHYLNVMEKGMYKIACNHSIFRLDTHVP